MSTYLVTGGAGFIGSHLCDELIKNHSVIVLDNLFCGSKDNVPKEVQFVEGDIRDADLVRHLLSQVDGCFHLAAIVSIPLCSEDMVLAHDVNLTGTLNIMEQAHKQSHRSKPVPIIFASSSSVYDESDGSPINETDPTKPISFYAELKLTAEFYGRFVNQIYGLPFTALRLFNVYGHRQKLESSYSGVVSIFLNDLLQDRELSINGDGLQSRDFIFVKDVVQFFIQAMNHTSNDMQIYNVCTGTKQNILTLAKIMSQELHKELKLAMKPPRVGDIRHSLGCPALANQRLEVTAQTSLESGLREFIASVLKSRKV
jgi:UDP-glucose 4-epimerase